MENGNETGFSLIGIGPGRVESMTIEAVEVAKNADVRLYEAYTALWPEVTSTTKVHRPQCLRTDLPALLEL